MCSLLLFVDQYYPEEIEVTEELTGSNEARVKWSFPEGISELKYFILSAKRESDNTIMSSNSVAAANREDVVKGLEPMVQYSVTIAAVYKDGNKRKSVVEYKYGGKCIMWCWSECACYVICMPYRLQLSRRYKNHRECAGIHSSNS